MDKHEPHTAISGQSVSDQDPPCRELYTLPSSPVLLTPGLTCGRRRALLTLLLLPLRHFSPRGRPGFRL